MDEKNILITIGGKHYVLPIIDCILKKDNFALVTLQDETTINLSTNNFIIFSAKSSFMKAILENSSENFYQPITDKKGKVLMKKVFPNRSFKIYQGGKKTH